ncbi:mitochondrial iron transporter mitoferrin [Leptinotarsa decemlineata]|uniref:mitochondrial iron transporter mitoferrin n=1 Tax=Leptinotarsa decemlineata TaxID=7539 RepID=UPI000C254D08|nr:mitoferrin-1 [Leptinotarsa decemlineata]XP_023019268.1 mitoferrin-1 [Leptinotarsa decemlineata]
MNSDDYETLPTDNVSTHMIAGAIAGVMEHCVMYPLDSVKTRMQSLTTSGTEGIGETLIRMVRHEGLLRPVRGMSAMVVGAGPSHALYFSSYEYLKNTLTQYTNSARYHTLIFGASGCLATLIHDGFMNPAEVVKQRMQMTNSPYKTALECAVSTYQKEGLKAFYRSYTTQLTMNVPFQSIHFVIYELSQKWINKDRVYNPAAHMVSGALAGGIAAAITTPLDVCKTLLNTQQGEKATGLLNAIKTVYRLGGPWGYFRGVQARTMYQMPATGICWSTYEFFKFMLGTTNPEMRSLPSNNASTEEENKTKTDTNESHDDTHTNETYNLKPRELPAMSGASLSISFNTMHNTDYRQKDTILDICHT